MCTRQLSHGSKTMRQLLHVYIHLHTLFMLEHAHCVCDVLCTHTCVLHVRTCIIHSVCTCTRIMLKVGLFSEIRCLLECFPLLCLELLHMHACMVSMHLACKCVQVHVCVHNVIMHIDHVHVRICT